MSIRKMIPKRGSRAFTLLELIVVIVILGILAALAIPTFARVIATSELEVAEVTAASVVRETLALSAFNQEGLITEDSITTAAADLPGRVAYSAGTYAAETVPYQVVFGKWEFSGNDRTLSAVRSGTPVGSRVGVALYVPEVGCAFAKSEGNNVEAWSMMGLDPTSCNGAGAFLSPEELLELSAPPMPGGLELTFGCSTPDGKPGWNITFDSGMVDVFINGVYMGQYSSGACVPGKASDNVVVTPADGDGPGWDGGVGGDEDPSELPEEPENPTEPTPEGSVPVLSDGKSPILVDWTPPTDGAVSDGVIVSREPAGGGVKVPVFTGDSGGTTGEGEIYDPAPSGDYIYEVQPTLDGKPVGNPIPVTVGKTVTPAPVESDGGNGSKPAAVLIGDSAMIAWGGVADTKNAPLTGYHVYRSTNGGTYLPIGTNSKTDTTFMNGPLSAGTYCYKVSSYGLGGESGKTAEACVTVAGPSWSETTPTQNKLIITPEVASAGFGSSVDIEGDTMVVGAWQDTANGPYSGSAYVFARSGGTWAQQGKLIPEDGSSNDKFGSSIALSGNTVVVGASMDSDNGAASGSAYVFTRSGTTWTEQSKLLASDSTTGDAFGQSIDVDGDIIIAGAYADSPKGAGSGSAYIFTRSGTTWTEQDKIVPSDGEQSDFFGHSVSISGDSVVIGASNDGDNGSRAGAAYVFTRSGTTWAEQDKLLASDGKANDYFGKAVSISGNTIVSGAYGNDEKGAESGAAYVFTRNGTVWNEEKKLTALDGISYDYFGDAVAVRGDTVIVGALIGKAKTTDSGSAYIFSRSGGAWSQAAKLAASDGAQSDYFGISVAIDGGTAVVGSRDDDTKEWNSGSVYLFKP